MGAVSFWIATYTFYGRDQYYIIGLLKISHLIKELPNSVYLKQVLEMH